MTIVEQILLKLGIDQSQIKPGLDDFRKKVNDATLSAHKSFLHVGSATRAFHKVLEQISERAPFVGAAIRMGLSPITGTMIAATAVFVYFNKLIEETAQRLDKISEMNSKPFGDIKKAAREAADEVAKLNREFARAGRREATDRSNKDRTTAFTEGFDEQESRDRTARAVLESRKALALDKVKMAQESGKINQAEALKRNNAVEAEFGKKIREQEIAAEGHKGGLIQTERVGLLPDINKAKAEAEKWKKLAALPYSADRLAKDKTALEAFEGRREGLKQRLGDAEKRGAEQGDKGSFGLDWAVRLDNWAKNKVAGQSPGEEAQGLRAEIKTLELNIEEARRRVKSRDISQEEAIAKQKEADEQLKKLTDRFEELGTSLEKTKLKQEELRNQPAIIQQQQIQSASKELLPSVEQLAQAGTWMRRYGTGQRFFNPGPYAGQARELMALEQRAPWEAAMGNMDGHNRDVLRIRDLKESLRGAGAMAPADANEKIETHLEALSTALGSTIKNGSMNVTVANTD
jgi:hypothetical protein